jgi:Transposase DDE domain
MRSQRSLRHWLAHLLPQHGRCAQQAAASLLRALLLGFTTDLSQLARQLDRHTTAKGRRQYLVRWLDRPQWDAPALYPRLPALLPQVLARPEPIPLLLDFTHLENAWSVLQLSVGWQGRALPLYRCVTARKQPDATQAALVRAVLTFVREQLPGPASRYVLVMDRAFPSNSLIQELVAQQLRFVIRVSGEWKMTHADHTGRLRQASSEPGRIGPVPVCFQEVLLGERRKGRKRWSQAHVVMVQAEGAREPWYLLTSETEARAVVGIYRQRVQIECEFKDVKGPWGLDALAQWQDRDRIARFLAWVAVYEWRLAWLWVGHQLQHWQARLCVKGRLSWIRITREWIRIQLHPTARSAPAWL